MQQALNSAAQHSTVHPKRSCRMLGGERWHTQRAARSHLPLPPLLGAAQGLEAKCEEPDDSAVPISQLPHGCCVQGMDRAGRGAGRRCARCRALAGGVRRGACGGGVLLAAVRVRLGARRREAVPLPIVSRQARAIVVL